MLTQTFWVSLQRLRPRTQNKGSTASAKYQRCLLGKLVLSQPPDRAHSSHRGCYAYWKRSPRTMDLMHTCKLLTTTVVGFCAFQCPHSRITWPRNAASSTSQRPVGGRPAPAVPAVDIKDVRDSRTRRSQNKTCAEAHIGVSIPAVDTRHVQSSRTSSSQRLGLAPKSLRW